MKGVQFADNLWDVAPVVCDFCSDRNRRAAWHYAAKGVDVETDPFLNEFTGASLRDDNGYMACEQCHDLIEKEDYNALCERAVDTFQKHNPAWQLLQGRKDEKMMALMLWQMVRHAFDLFVQNRVGEARPV